LKNVSPLCILMKNAMLLIWVLNIIIFFKKKNFFK
jgi:hypothetical protein